MTWISTFTATERYKKILKLSIFSTIFQNQVIWGHFTERAQPRQTKGLKVLVRFIVLAIKFFDS